MVTSDTPVMNIDALAAQVVDASRPVAPDPKQTATRFRAPGRPFAKRIRPAFAESFRMLALQVSQPVAERQVQTILVMSAYGGEGRTTTVANLGIALAETGRRVVLVECDVHRPGLARLFPTATNGSSGNGSATSPVAVVPTDVSGLVLLQRIPGNGAAVPAVAVERVLEALRPVADTIILDSPPCLRYSDAFFLAPLVDGVLFVVGRRNQDVEAQRNVQAQLARLGANVLGAIYNEG